MRNSLRNELYIAAVVTLLGLLTLTKARAAVESKPAPVQASENFDAEIDEALEAAAKDPTLTLEAFDKVEAPVEAPAPAKASTVSKLQKTKAPEAAKAATTDSDLGNLSAEEADFLKAAGEQAPAEIPAQAR